MKIVIATGSKNRLELLKIAGIEATISPATIDETIYLDPDPHSRSQAIALAKARAVKSQYKNALVIGADTIAVYRNKIIGKPKYKMDALETLKSLSGTSHLIITGWGIYNTRTRQKFQGSSETKIVFKTLSNQELTDYVNDNDVTQWAASYSPLNTHAISFVEKISGSLTGFTHGFPLEQILPIIRTEGGL